MDPSLQRSKREPVPLVYVQIISSPRVTFDWLTGLGGGFNERGNVEYRSHDSDDDEFDDFGRRKKKYRKPDKKVPAPVPVPPIPSRPVVDDDEDEEEDEDDDDEAVVSWKNHFFSLGSLLFQIRFLV